MLIHLEVKIQYFINYLMFFQTRCQKAYPELKRGKDLIVETLKNEEEKFSSLLDRGMKILDQNLEKVKIIFCQEK